MHLVEALLAGGSPQSSVDLQNQVSMLDQISETMGYEDYSLSFSHFKELIEKISFCYSIECGRWLIDNKQLDVTILHPH
jgi:hypothetical protein